MPDTILDLTTRVTGIDSVKAGMTDVAASVSAATQKMTGDFSSFSASSMAANEGVRAVMSKLPPEFIKVEAGGIYAFEQIKRRVVEATSEVGALRQEILSTNDAAKLDQLKAQLDQARARMTAARTEMRAMRFEITDTTEKADLLGESLGVKIPSSLGRLLGQIPALQSLMNAAFAPITVLFFADALIKVVEWIEKATESLAGYTEEVKKAMEEAKRANEEQVRHAGSVREANEKIAETTRRLGEVGKSSWDNFSEGAKRANEETSWLLDTLTVGAVSSYRTIEHATTDAANQNVLLNATLREQLKNRMEVGAAEDRAALKNKEQMATAEQVGRSRISQIREEIRALNEKEALESKIAAEEAGAKKPSDSADIARARADVEAQFAGKRLELQRQLAEQFATVSIAAAKSEVTARQSIETEFINFYERGLHRMYASGQITRDAELAGEKAAAQQRLAVRLNEIEQQKSLALREQSATGKDATPEVTHLDEERVRAEVQTQDKLNEITQRGAQETLRERNELNLATIRGAKTLADAEINAVVESAQAQLAARRISLEQETEILKAAAAQRIDNDLSVAREQLRQAQEFPEKNKAAITQLNADVLALERQKTADLERIDAEYTTKHLEMLQREAEETLRVVETTTNRRLTAELSADEKRLTSHRVTLDQWATLERAAIARWYAENSATLNAVLAKEKAIYGEDSLEYKKLVDKKEELDQERLAKLERVNQQILSSEAKTWQTIQGQFNNAVTSIITGKEKVGNAFAQLWTELIGNATQSLLKIVEQFAISELKMVVLHKTAITQQQTMDQLWASLKLALGIRTATQDTAAQATIDTAAQTATVARHTATNTALALSDTAYTTEYLAAVTARTVGEAAAQTAASSFHAAADVGQVISSAAVGAASAAAAAAPGGPAAMAAAAAAAEAIILSFVPQASVFALRGGILDKDTLVQAHAKEMILPPPLSVGLKNLIDSGGLNKVSASTAATMAGLHGSRSGAAMTALHGDPGATGSAGAAAHTSPGAAGLGSSVTHKTVNVSNRPTIIVNHPGQKVTQGEIEAAVRRGVRNRTLELP